MNPNKIIRLINKKIEYKAQCVNEKCNGNIFHLLLDGANDNWGEIIGIKCVDCEKIHIVNLKRELIEPTKAIYKIDWIDSETIELEKIEEIE